MTERSALSPDERRQAQYYDRIASRYDAHYFHMPAMNYRRRVLRQTLDGLELKGATVLDAMCGGGENSACLADAGARIIGLDISPKQCDLYRNRFPDADCVCRSVLDTGFPANSFDMVMTESLHHLPPHLDAGMLELIRVLRPGGRLLIWEPCAGSLLDVARRVWYALDSSFFESNEAAIDIPELLRTYKDRLKAERLFYGGNLAYLFVFSSMQFRIPLSWVSRYAAFLTALDMKLESLQGRRTACWAAALLQKKGEN